MDLRSPYVISITELPRQEGASMNWEATLDAPSDMGVEMIGVPAGSPLRVALTLHSVSEGVYVSGTVSTRLTGQCARCLRDIAEDVTESVGELVFYPERRAALVEEGDEEAAAAQVVENDHIDLEPILRDAVVLALPFTPLCRADCPGLCSECGQPWDELPADHHHEQVDSRFDALAELEAQLRDQEQQ